MELVLALVCDEAHVTPEGNLDIVGALHDLYAPGFPARQDHITLVLVLEWGRADQGRFTFTIELVGPDGNPSLTLSGQTDVDTRPADRAPARTRLVMPLENVVFPEPGVYQFTMRVKGHDLLGPRLRLLRMEPDTQSGSGPTEPSARVTAGGDSNGSG